MDKIVIMAAQNFSFREEGNPLEKYLPLALNQMKTRLAQDWNPAQLNTQEALSPAGQQPIGWGHTLVTRGRATVVSLPECIVYTTTKVEVGEPD